MLKTCTICSQAFVTGEQFQGVCNAPECRAQVQKKRNYENKCRRRAARDRHKGK